MKLDYLALGKVLLSTPVVKMFLVFTLVAIFLIMLRGLIGRAFKNYKPKGARTSTLIIVEIAIVFVITVVWMLFR
jgi:hypothetical protein